MTRFEFVPYPMHGHVNPMLPLVAELIHRGEEVAVAVAEPFAEAFRELGCEVTVIDTTVITEFSENPSKEERRQRLRTVARMLRERPRIAARLRGLWRYRAPDVVVADLAARWGAIAAQKSGIPLASFSVTYAVNEQTVTDSLRRRHSERFVSMVGRLGLLGYFHPALRDAADLALVNTPPGIQPERQLFGPRYRFVGPLLRDTSGYGDPGFPLAELENARTLFVSPGTVFGCGPAFFRSIAEAFDGTEWTVVMATASTEPGQLGPLPANVIAARYVPQTPVLARSDVFVTRASMNSAMEALLRGVPMIAVPRAYDQKGVAARLEELGVGITLSDKADGAAFLRAARALVADEAVRENLAALAEPVRQSDPAAEAADALQKFAANG